MPRELECHTGKEKFHGTKKLISYNPTQNHYFFVCNLLLMYRVGLICSSGARIYDAEHWAQRNRNKNINIKRKRPKPFFFFLSYFFSLFICCHSGVFVRFLVLFCFFQKRNKLWIHKRIHKLWWVGSWGLSRRSLGREKPGSKYIVWK